MEFYYCRAWDCAPLPAWIISCRKRWLPSTWWSRLTRERQNWSRYVVYWPFFCLENLCQLWTVLAFTWNVLTVIVPFFGLVLGHCQAWTYGFGYREGIEQTGHRRSRAIAPRRAVCHSLPCPRTVCFFLYFSCDCPIGIIGLDDRIVSHCFLVTQVSFPYLDFPTSLLSCFFFVNVHCRNLIVGGGAPEIELSLRLAEYSRTLVGAQAVCVRMFGEALEVIPNTLAENAGLNSIETVTELRNRHALGEIQAGINVKRGAISNIYEENVVQPLLVTTSCIQLASETVRSILKIDDIVRGDQNNRHSRSLEGCFLSIFIFCFFISHRWMVEDDGEGSTDRTTLFCNPFSLILLRILWRFSSASYCRLFSVLKMLIFGSDWRQLSHAVFSHSFPSIKKHNRTRLHYGSLNK